MDLGMIARTIQLIIAPAVMITSCCIFTNGLLTHYASIGERLRVSVRERVDLLRDLEVVQGAHSNHDSHLINERLEDIGFQIPKLLRHHFLVQTSLASTFIAMTVYILDMFGIAYSVILNRTDFYSFVLIVFLIGVASQLLGVVYAVSDTFLSHKIYAYEAHHVMTLGKNNMEHSV